MLSKFKPWAVVLRTLVFKECYIMCYAVACAAYAIDINLFFNFFTV